MSKVIRKVPEELKVRKLSQHVYDALKIRATRNGRSLGAEMAQIITNAIEMDATSKLGTGFQKLVGVDSIWESVPGRLYECTAGLTTFRISIMQGLLGSGGEWIFHVDSLTVAETSATDLRVWHRLTDSTQLALKTKDPASSFQASLNWLKHLARTRA